MSQPSTNFSLIQHIYNSDINYIPGPPIHHQEQDTVYTHSIPPTEPHQPWPQTTQVSIKVRTQKKTHKIQGTLIGPRHVLTSGYPIYTHQGWAQKITIIIGKEKISVDQAYTFFEWSQHKDPRYNIAILIIHKFLRKKYGYSGLLSIPDSHLQNEQVHINTFHTLYTLQKIDTDRLHYHSFEKVYTGTSLRIQQWKTSFIIGLETHGVEETPYTLRLTPLKIETIAQKISETIKKTPTLAFGKKEWAYHFGDIGEEPPLPFNIKKILNAPCPFWSGKKVYETHLLTLIPETVNGQPLNLQLLKNLVQKPFQGSETKYRNFFLGEYSDPPVLRSHWTLLTQDVLPKSRNKSFTKQQKLIQRYPNYEVTNIIDAVVVLFMEHARNGNRFYSSDPSTFTRCQEKHNIKSQLVVGGFSESGLSVDFNLLFASEDVGVGAQRRFYQDP